jgi:hypothetical protein
MSYLCTWHASATLSQCLHFIRTSHDTNFKWGECVLTFCVPQLSKYPALNNFEKQTSVPKVYAILGLAGLYFFLIFFNIAGEFLVNIAGFIIPSYYSLNALFSASKVDDTQVHTQQSA